MKPVILSYFTRGTFYEKEAACLRASCEKWGLEYCIEGIEPFGKWHHHTCYKPIYILQKMRELKRPVVWIDADAEIVQNPTLFERLDCDIAVRICEGYPAGHPSYLYAGTIYLDSHRRALELVEKWAKTCERAIQRGELTVDQQVLGSLVAEGAARLYPLPKGYVAIFEEVMKPEERVIVHYQASRLYKKIIDGELSLGMLEHLSVEELRSLRPKVGL